MATKRIELKQCSVVFNPEDHTYYLPEKDKYLSGITGMLERQLFPDTYVGIPEAIIKQAAEYGTSVHQSIENFDMDWENDGTQEVADYISLTSENGLVHETSEYLITDGENYASMIDKVYRVDETTFDIGDIKTYGVMTPDKREKARWQLSIYAYLFELMNKKAKVRRIFILHIRNKAKKDGSFDHISDFIELVRIPSEIVKDLLYTDSIGQQFSNPYAIPEDIKSQESVIRKLIQVKTDAETRLNSIKARILSLMEAQDVKSWATETMRITRKLPSTRSSFSLADFKEAHSDIDIEPYMRTSQVAPGVSLSHSSMDNLEESREYKAAMALEDAINDMGWDERKFAQACTTMHRTLQQTLFRTIVAVLREYADPNRSVDPRNEASKEGSRKLMEVIDTLYIPFI